MQNIFPNKKGSHIGFVISFVIFVSFVIFLYGILGPVGKVESDKDFLLKHLEDKLIEDSSGQVQVVSIKPDSQGSACLDIGSLTLKNYFIVKDENNSVVNTSSKNIELNGNFFKVYSSDYEFNVVGSVDCSGGISTNYKTGLDSNEEYVFESKIAGLVKDYDSDYSELKSRFNLPDINEFSFSFVYNNRTEIKPLVNQENVPTSVFVELVPVTYITKNADINTGYIKVILW